MKKFFIILISSASMVGMEQPEQIVVKSARGTEYVLNSQQVNDSGYLRKNRLENGQIVTDLPDTELRLLVEILQNQKNIPEAIKTGKLYIAPFIDWNKRDFFKLLTTFGFSRFQSLAFQTFFTNHQIIVWQDNSQYPWVSVLAPNINAPFFEYLKIQLREHANKVGIVVKDKVIPYADMDMILYLCSLKDVAEIREYIDKLGLNRFFQLIRQLTDLEVQEGKIILGILCQYQLYVEKGMQKEIPEDIKKLLPQGISLVELKERGLLPEVEGKTLKLNDCCLSDITNLPDYFRLKEIMILELDNNRLTQFPKELLPLLQQLEKLSLAYNRLRVMENDSFVLPLSPSQMVTLPSLKQLIVHNNSIKELQVGWATDLTNLEYLDLSHNLLGADMFAPGWSWGLSRLRNLYLNNNKITRLPGGWASNLANLEELDLSSNPLRKVEKGWAQGLKKIKTIIIDEGSPVYNDINWELNGVLAYFRIRRPKVTIKTKIEKVYMNVNPPRGE